MKALIPLAVIPLLLSACETTVVDRHYPRRSVAYVERDSYYGRHHRSYGRSYDYDRRDVVVATRPSYHSSTVVVNPRPTYRPSSIQVRYYNDNRGRYYFRDGRRIYVNSGVYY